MSLVSEREPGPIKLLTVFGDVRADLGHGVTDGWIGVEELVVLAGIPLGKRRQLLRDGREETDDDADGSGLHVVEIGRAHV